MTTLNITSALDLLAKNEREKILKDPLGAIRKSVTEAIRRFSSFFLQLELCAKRTSRKRTYMDHVVKSMSHVNSFWSGRYELYFSQSLFN